MTDRLKQIIENLEKPEVQEKMKQWFEERFTEENKLIEDFKSKTTSEKIDFIRDAIKNDNKHSAVEVMLYAYEYGEESDHITTPFTYISFYLKEIDTYIEELHGQGTVYSIYSKTNNFDSVIG